MWVVGEEPMMRATVVTRRSDTAFTTTQPLDVNAARLSGFAQPSRLSF